MFLVIKNLQLQQPRHRFHRLSVEETCSCVPQQSLGCVVSYVRMEPTTYSRKERRQSSAYTYNPGRKQHRWYNFGHKIRRVGFVVLRSLSFSSNDAASSTVSRKTYNIHIIINTIGVATSVSILYATNHFNTLKTFILDELFETFSSTLSRCEQRDELLGVAPS